MTTIPDDAQLGYFLERQSTTAAPKSFRRRLAGRPVAVICLAYLALVTLVAVLAPIMLPDVAHQHAGNLLESRQGPSSDHWLGTDSLGRDVLDRLLVGTRVTALGAAEALAVVLVIGVPFGLVAGFARGALDSVLNWVANLLFSMPGIIVILVVLAVFPANMAAAMVTLGILVSPSLFRVVRSATLAVREELYVSAAQVSGLGRGYILAKHILPRIQGAIIVQCSLLTGVAILAQTGLAFLNLLVPAPAPSWGGMVQDGTLNISLQPWLIWPPGVAIVLTILALGLLADAVRDAATESWSAPTTFSHRKKPYQSTRRAQESNRGGQTALLKIAGVTISTSDPGGVSRRIVQDASIEVRSGETLGIVGESGCGKTITAMSVLGLLPPRVEVEAGSIWFRGRDLATLSERELRGVRGSEIALISQEPMISLNPAFRVGWQLAEVVRRHHHVSRQAARARVLELLRSVRLPDAESVASRYPHELSGGMAQRVSIARALSGEPELLVADEPTTALDVTVQAEILDLLRDVQSRSGASILLITHDWGVVADICDRATVMYAGEVVETATVRDLVRRPMHPYTRALLEANPHTDHEADSLPVLPGSVPVPGNWPKGCHFHPRCGYATVECIESVVPLIELGARSTRCLHYSALTDRRPEEVSAQ